MSSRPEPPTVSLPSIHELFPEHLMNGPPAPGPSRDTYSRGRLESNYRYPSDTRPHSHRPIGAPYPPQDVPFVLPPAHTPSLPPSRDNHRLDRQGHTVVTIPPSPPGRSPKSQESNVHPDAQPISYSGSSLPVDDPENLSDEDAASTGTPTGIPRKHICPMCHKAFNRPSSLKIHYNTHTGATPFRCPWPKCGREFNVNSNMRRHYRNHTANANQESPEDGPRRRRRRSSASSTNSPTAVMQQQSVGETTRALPAAPATNSVSVPAPRHQAPPSQSDASHQYSRYRVRDYGTNTKDYHHEMELDEAVDEYRYVSEDPHHRSGSRLPVVVPMIRASAAEPPLRGNGVRYHGAPPPVSSQHHHHHHHSHSHSSSSSTTSMRLRALTPGSSFHSSSPSPSPSPSLSSTTSSSPPPSTLTSPVHSPAMLHAAAGSAQQQYQYSPSMPYLRHGAGGDPHVSTALRPAFSNNNASRHAHARR